MEEIDVPTHFLCPISLQLMRDPVTVSSGITYDRVNIERWLLTCKNNNNNTCPVTKQVLQQESDPMIMIPNHTLRRLIQSWCIVNASHGIERIPTPKPPIIDKAQIVEILNDANNKSTCMKLKSLRRLRSITLQSERNKGCLEAAGAVEFLATTIVRSYSSDTEICDEALSVLCHLNISEGHLKNLIIINGEEFLESLRHVLKCGNYQSRSYAIMLLNSIFEVADPFQLINVKLELFIEIVHVLSDDQISQKASKAALKLLGELCPWGRNRTKAVEGGAVSALIDLLLKLDDDVITEKRCCCELMLTVLDQLCRCAEGRAELLKHGAGLAVVSNKILRVSHAASDRAVRILSLVCKFSATPRVLEEMLQVGVVSKLCLVLQVDGAGVKTKERVREVLKSNSRAWNGSSCIPAHLLSS